MVRKDLEPGLQIAQSCHVVFSFSQEHPEETKTWMIQSNYIAVLSCLNEQELILLLENAEKYGIKFSVFREPDIDNQITAIAIEPGVKSRKLCSSLKLALRGE